MKEIKFRVWAAGEMHYPDIISFDASAASFAPIGGGGGSFRVPLADVMQFTGIRDKNGREVFEGDILRTPHFKRGAVTHYMYHIVEWSAKFAGWFARSTVAKHDSDGSVQLWVYAQNASSFEVAGNIHANPDLLK